MKWSIAHMDAFDNLIDYYTLEPRGCHMRHA